MLDVRHPSMFNGLPVVAGPAEIDVTSAEMFQTILRTAAANGHPTIVVGLTGTRYCDSCGLRVLDAAHQRAVSAGGELRLVLTANGSAARVLATTGLDRCIPCFTDLAQALPVP